MDRRRLDGAPRAREDTRRKRIRTSEEASLARPQAAVAPAIPEGRSASTIARPEWSLANLLESRLPARILLTAGVAQAGLVALGFSGWPCPFADVFHLPCPGCGLSRATSLLLHGELRTALVVHPFSPLVFVILVVLSVGALAPAAVVEDLARRLRALEIRTGLTFILATAFVTYGLLRLAVAVTFGWRALV